MPKLECRQLDPVTQAFGKALEQSSESGGIQSVGRAFAILELIARVPSGVSLSELSRSLNIHTSTVFHLVQTMVGLGYVRQAKKSKRYLIGRPLFALAASCEEDCELVTLATPILHSLSDRTGETSHLGVLSGYNVLVVARSPVPGSTKLISSAELLRPAYATSLGKALLASMSDDQVTQYLNETPLERLTERTITDPAHLRGVIDNIRQEGVAYDDGEYAAGLRCIAQVVRNHAGSAVGAIGVSGPAKRQSLHEVRTVAGHVRQAAAELSGELGFRPERRLSKLRA